MDPVPVYGDKHVFCKYKWTNFKTNLTNLRAAKDLQLYSPAPLAAPGYPVWA
jgi:hypothetical protein